MSTSQTIGLSEPVGAAKIQAGTLGYVCARNRQRQYDLVIEEFKKSGLTQAELARRLGKSPEVISRLLARPGNWESNTLSELLFAISGAVPAYRVDYPISHRSYGSAEHIGSTFESWLDEAGLREEVTVAAIKAVIAEQLAREMKKKKLTKKRMAELMKTSRAQLDRLLDPDNGNATIESLQRAARIVGRELRMELV
jgi:antitoxin HicB